MTTARGFQNYPPLAANHVHVRTSDGVIHDVPEKKFDLAVVIDPELRTVPGRDFDVLALTREDRFFLFDIGCADWRER